MLADLGGADICYSGPGWTGHLAFIEPDAPEFAGSLAEWKKMGPRVCTFSPFTIAQNSLHGCFGCSGDLCAVPPKAATIGPAEVIGSKHRIDMHAITVDGSFASWQRLTTRLVLHGPVTPRVPESILQTLRTDVWVSEIHRREHRAPLGQGLLKPNGRALRHSGSCLTACGGDRRWSRPGESPALLHYSSSLPRHLLPPHDH
jgi:hypothetical protein